MSADFDKCIAAAPDPEKAANRLARLREEAATRTILDTLPDELAQDLVNLITVSRFLFHFLCRFPDEVALIGRPSEIDASFIPGVTDDDALRRFKYRELLKISWMDISGRWDYPVVLRQLSHLAEVVLKSALGLATSEKHGDVIKNHFCVFALGKLGAAELNFSSFWWKPYNA